MITVAFSRSNLVGSRLIRWFTKGRVSHVLICTTLVGVAVVMHAALGGVRILPRAYFEKHNEVVAEYEVAADLSTGLQNAMQMLSEGYDYVGLFGFIPVLIARWFGLKWKNPLASARAVICSEFVIAFDSEKLITPWQDIDKETAIPEEMYHICEGNPVFFKPVEVVPVNPGR